MAGVAHAASFDGRNVDWNPAAAPGLRVLHQRTGEPYKTSTTGEDWYLRFDGAGPERTVEAVSRRGDNASVLSRVTTGSRLATVAGRDAFVLKIDGAPRAVYTDVRPGLTAFSEVRGDLEPVLRMIASLSQLDQDDSRLDDLALAESYEDKRD